MSMGVGLGAFVDGFAKGYGIRRQFEADRRERRNRDALEAIDTDARAAFDKRVTAGTATEGDFESFWLEYALPRRRNELLRQGDVAGARALQEWGESDAAKRGGKLFSSAMLKAQTGDFDGALEDAIAAARVKGYIEHGLELQGQEPIEDADGNLVGYRLKIKQPDGDVIEQDIAIEDLPRLIATFANPDAAWQSQQEARAAADKRKTELEDYEKKKQIEKKYAAGTDKGKAYREAREALMKNDLDFADLTPEEQDQRTRDYLDAADRYAAGDGGAEAAAPAAVAKPATPKMVVDRVTGQPVAATPKDAAGIARPNAGPGGIERRPLAPVSPQPQRPLSRQERIDEAAAMMADGGNPQFIAQRLLNWGIGQDEWPEPVRRAYEQTKPGAPAARQSDRQPAAVAGR